MLRAKLVGASLEKGLCAYNTCKPRDWATKCTVGKGLTDAPLSARAELMHQALYSNFNLTFVNFFKFYRRRVQNLFLFGFHF